MHQTDEIVAHTFEVLMDMRVVDPTQAHGLVQQPRNASRSVPRRNQRERILNVESSADHVSVPLRNSLQQGSLYKDQRCTPSPLKPTDQMPVLAMSVTYCEESERERKGQLHDDLNDGQAAASWLQYQQG
jgi:hypothetical protein